MGSRPAVLVVDFSCGFTDPACTLGSELTAEVEATKRLLDAAREKGLPVVFTTIGFEPSLKDGGLWLQKVPALGDLQLGGHWVEIDPRLEPREDETVDREEGRLGLLRDEPGRGSRLTADRLRHPLRRDDERLHPCHRGRPAPERLADARPAGVRRRPCTGPHEANLFDIQAKYADVVPLDDALAYVQSVPDRVGAAM